MHFCLCHITHPATVLMDKVRELLGVLWGQGQSGEDRRLPGAQGNLS
jgi:hypothetical protein